MTIKERYEKGFNPDEEYMGRDKEVNRIEPLVSVCTATYQHRDYIEDCIEGILMQETDFPIEIIIGEDESTDGTREICKQYAETHPDKIRLFLRDRQTSCMFDDEGKRIRGFNGMWTRKSARGKYIAMCEGDDYWTDPLKLQKQVDFMEEHPEYSMCFHNYYYKREEREELIPREPNKNSTVTLQHLARNVTGIQTLTVFFRNYYEPLIPGEFIDKVTGSYFIFLVLAERGDLKYIDERMAVYRIHKGGIWSGKSKYGQGIMSLQNKDQMIQYFKNEKDIFSLLKTIYVEKSIYYTIYFLIRLRLMKAFRFLLNSFKHGVSKKHLTYWFEYIITTIKRLGFERD